MVKNNQMIKLVNMAFASGSETKAAADFTLYKGIAPVHIVGVNPNAAELQELFPNRESIEEPNYLYQKEGEKDGVFVTFYVKVNPDSKEAKPYNEDGKFNLISRYTIMLKNEPFMNKDKTKVQVINSYGDTGWVTTEQLKNKELPQYMINNEYITDGMRPAFVGEESLVEFMKVYINIPSTRFYDNNSKSWATKSGPELEKCLAGFTTANIAKILKGDVTPISSNLRYQPNNQIKVLFGVRTADDNREWQDACSRLPIRFNDRNYTRVIKEMQNIKDNGGYPSTDFGNAPYPFIKHEIVPTSFGTSTSSEGSVDNEDPFASFG